MLKNLIFICLFSLSIVASCQQKAEDESRGYIVKTGDAAPEFVLQLVNGESISSKELIGKVVVLQFTASWCSVCRKEMPHLENEIWQKYKEDDFLLIGVDYDEPLEKVIQFQKTMKTTYPMALDPGAEIFALFANKKSGVTRNVVIDKNGKIVFLTRLFNMDEFEKMKEKIDELLDD